MADLGAIGKRGILNGAKRCHSGIISGTVRDGAGNPVRHMVRAYDMLTGERSGGAFSDPTTGNYSIRCRLDFNGLHFVAEFDDTGNYNARIFDRVQPL